MTFPFHYKKAAQVAATLLRLAPKQRMNYYRLLKLLYIADRESVRETGRPIIGGRVVAMERGPLHSTILDLIKGVDCESPTWFENFRTDHYDVEMIQDPGNGELSRYELGLLERIAREYQDDDEWEVGRKTHAFAEFAVDPPAQGRVRTIPLDAIIDAVGRSADKDAILRDAQEVAVFDRVFGR
jgi:uncharacterized phage-associated protein